MKKIAIYSPYLDTASGGEKYMLSMAEILSETFEVDVLLDEHLLSFGANELKRKNESIHGLDLSKVQFKKSPLGKGGNFVNRFKFLLKYDWFFYLSDGSIPYSSAKNNVIHFQMPLETVASNGLWGEIKKNRWDLAIYNSNFTKEHVEKLIKVRGEVLYPPVDTSKILSKKKQNQIVTTGRFAKFENPKKQEVMIKVFKELVDEGKLKDWSLHLIGSLSPGNEDFFEELEKLTVGYQIFLHPNLQIEKLRVIIGESKLYWHAMGFGESNPKLFEHFGISTVEGMAAGCVPIVINKGGQKEIVENGVSGVLWDSLDELKKETIRLAGDEKRFHNLSQNAVDRSKYFSKEKFSGKLLDIIHGN